MGYPQSSSISMGIFHGKSSIWVPLFQETSILDHCGPFEIYLPTASPPLLGGLFMPSAASMLYCFRLLPLLPFCTPAPLQPLPRGKMKGTQGQVITAQNHTCFWFLCRNLGKGAKQEQHHSLACALRIKTIQNL